MLQSSRAGTGDPQGRGGHKAYSDASVSQGSHPAGAANGVTQSQEDGSHTLRTQGASVSSMLGKCLLTVWGKRALIQRVPVSMASYVTVPRSGHRCDLAKCRVGSSVHTGH